MLTTGLTRTTAVVALTLALTACSGDDSSGPQAEERSPEDVVAAAAATLTDTSGVQLSLSTDDLPDGINAIQKAVGVATDAPAFEGTLTVLLTGQAFEVPVIAVDDEVFAQIPLTPGWSPVDPEEYGAPDPAGFLSPDDGFAAILESATDLEEGESVRGGADNSEILTTYTGSVPGDVVDKVIPGATRRLRPDRPDHRGRRAAGAGADRGLLLRRRAEHLHRRVRGLRHHPGHHGTVSASTRPRTLLALAAVAVAFAAADTYVVVLALPEMMAAVGVPIDQLQKAAPIVSGFLLGYVAMLPLIGRIADLRGRVPVLVAALVVFAAGSLLTALAYDMPTMVAGRFLQGVGGGGLVPATLALVADLYPVERRGVPLGVVSAVQEIGSVLGPLFGAVVLSVADWRFIFVVNLVVGLVLAVAIRRLAGDRSPPTGRFDWPGAAVAARHPGRRSAGLRQTTAAAARPHLGRGLRPLRRRRPLADPGRRGRHRRRRAVPGAHADRQPAAGRPPRLGARSPVRRTSPAPCCSPRPSRA